VETPARVVPLKYRDSNACGGEEDWQNLIRAENGRLVSSSRGGFDRGDGSDEGVDFTRWSGMSDENAGRGIWWKRCAGPLAARKGNGDREREVWTLPVHFLNGDFAFCLLR
jgi:hypothetical protein